MAEHEYATVEQVGSLDQRIAADASRLNNHITEDMREREKLLMAIGSTNEKVAEISGFVKSLRWAVPLGLTLLGLIISVAIWLLPVAWTGY